MTQAELITKLQIEKAKLNPAQREAVEAIDGPVMVLAGPGTGKTQVLAFRIAEILQQTDISPRNILALTFTESGVVAMRERLVSLIGVTGYGVGIYTFHSFANRVISEAGAEFYRTHSLDQIDDITQLKLIMQLVDQSGNELIRPIRAPYFYVKPIISTLRHLKSEGVSPEKLRDLCQIEILALENDPGSISKAGKSKGEVKQSIKDAITRLQRTIALSEIYGSYELTLAEKGLYDYEDMILFVLKSFEENPDLKAKYQEQFQYILLDEYQDTNNAQNTLVRLLADYFVTPNLFVVGDDKQSIYRFQGASMANILNFREWYPEATVISLTENYRSGQPILDNATHVINQNREQLTHVMEEIHADLHGQSSDGKIIFSAYPTADRETLGIVTRIQTLLKQGVPASEIAVIYRENSEAADIADVLTRSGVAFHLEAGDDVLKDPDVRQLISLLQLASNPRDEGALFNYLHSPYSAVATTDLITVGRWCKANRQSWWDVLSGEVPATDFPIQDWDTLVAIKEKINAWYRYSANHNVGETVEHIFVDSGLLNWIMTQPNHLERLHCLRCFFDDVKKLSAQIHFATMHDLFDRLAIRQTYNLALVCPPMVERSDEAIRLMTAHKSKGLEFDYVFIPHFTDSKWGRSAKGNVISLPEGIVAHHTVTDEQEIEEDRRLFYVALTRAKRGVFISQAEFDADNRKQMACQFLSELNDVVTETPNEASQLPLETFFSPVQTKFIDQTSQAYLRDIVTKQSLTPTGLNTYLTCPMEYLYRNVYCIPGVRDVNQAYGTAVHKALELWGSWSKEHNKPITLNEILSVFVEALVKEGLNEAETERFKNLGVDVLTAYFETHGQSWVTPLAMEYSFSPHNVILDGNVPITGKLDKIEPIKGSKLVRVIDYKTGKVRSRNEIEGTTASGEGDYKRQLVFYAVLAEADPFFPYTIGETAISFIDDHKRFTTEVFEISPTEKAEMKELIKHIYNEIISLNFDHTPHKNRWGKGDSLCDLLRAQAGVTVTQRRLDAPSVQSS